MKLQLALDRLTKEECFQIVRETIAFIDWIEVGTGVIKQYGLNIVREMKYAYPEKTIVADMKTCDAGKYEAAQAFEAGADITTVMAFSANSTISDSLKTASRFNGRVMIDLLGINNRSRIMELKDLGADLLSLHYGKDMQQEGRFQTGAFGLVSGIPHMEIAVAGGIDESSLPEILIRKPHAVIIGSGIAKAANRYETASKLKEMMKQYENNHSEHHR